MSKNIKILTDYRRRNIFNLVKQLPIDALPLVEQSCRSILEQWRGENIGLTVIIKPIKSETEINPITIVNRDESVIGSRNLPARPDSVTVKQEPIEDGDSDKYSETQVENALPFGSNPDTICKSDADLDIPDSIANSIGSPEQPHKVKLTEAHDETDKKTTSDSNKSISKPRRERFRKLRLKRIDKPNILQQAKITKTEKKLAPKQETNEKKCAVPKQGILANKRNTKRSLSLIHKQLEPFWEQLRDENVFEDEKPLAYKLKKERHKIPPHPQAVDHKPCRH